MYNTPMDFAQAIDYILSYTNYEREPALEYSPWRYSLERPRQILAWLGNPHLGRPTVHIAGTKGKGSTAAMIATALRAAGYRTGLFTSPHLHSFCERIQVDGQLIAEADWAHLTEGLRPHAEALHQAQTFGDVTTFELLVALAFAYFQEQGATFQVLETGLGGRLDATNVVPDPLVCVLTNISYDHTAILGDTLAKIAGEKAGIIKPGCIVVSAPQMPEAIAVFEETCQRLGVRLIRVGTDVAWEALASDMQGQDLVVHGLLASHKLRIPLLGPFQLENAATVVAALEALRLRGVEVSDESIALGLARTSWPGRLEILGQEPLLIVDGAHNVHSAKRLREALAQFSFNRAIFIVGISADKDIPGIAAELAPVAAHVLASCARNPRAAEPEVVADAFRSLGVATEVAPSTEVAFSQAMALAAPEDLILATGSLFVVAEVRELALQRLLA